MFHGISLVTLNLLSVGGCGRGFSVGVGIVVVCGSGCGFVGG